MPLVGIWAEAWKKACNHSLLGKEMDSPLQLAVLKRMSLLHLTSFPNTCFSTCLMMSSVVQLVSDFVFTPYVLRQRHQSNSPTCDLCDTERWCPRWAACSFPLRQSPRDLSPQEICISVSPTGAHDVSTFLSQNNNKLYFFPPWTNCVIWAG